MILVDTSVWAEHIRSSVAALRAALEANDVVVHEFVAGELALGHIKRGAEFLALMDLIRRVPTCEHSEVLALVRSARLEGSGIGWVDAHVIAACRVTGTDLMTFDRAQRSAGVRAGVRVI